MITVIAKGVPFCSQKGTKNLCFGGKIWIFSFFASKKLQSSSVHPRNFCFSAQKEKIRQMFSNEEATLQGAIIFSYSKIKNNGILFCLLPSRTG